LSNLNLRFLKILTPEALGDQSTRMIRAITNIEFLYSVIQSQKDTELNLTSYSPRY